MSGEDLLCDLLQLPHQQQLWFILFKYDRTVCLKQCRDGNNPLKCCFNSLEILRIQCILGIAFKIFIQKFELVVYLNLKNRDLSLNKGCGSHRVRNLPLISVRNTQASLWFAECLSEACRLLEALCCRVCLVYNCCTSTI